MDESSAYTECELEFIDEGHDPSLSAEICANEESRLQSDKKREKRKKDEDWGWWEY